MRNRFMHGKRALSERQRGFTLVELMVATVLASIVLLAVVSIFIASMEAWERAGARLALQRNAHLAMERMAADVRAGSTVVIGADETSMSIYRTTASGDSLISSYRLDGDELKNNHDTVLLDKLTSLRFTSSSGTRARMEMRLLDDRGTSGTDADDETLYMESVAVCRNQPVY
jgi:prepilin-type N-terminal cleavage/methylation domain-containing protein